MPIGRKILGSLVLCACLAACSNTPASSPPQSETAPRTDQPFVGKVWTSADESGLPGAMRIFLPEGTLLMDSCWETYRLVRWKAVDAQRIEWDEDGALIQATVVRATADTLELRLQLKTETKDERYRLAKTPYVCPDMPR